MQQYSWFVVGVAPGIGFAIAASSRRAALAVAGVVLTLASQPPATFLAARVWRALDVGPHGYLQVAALLAIVRLVVIMVLASSVAVGAASDLGRAGVWLRRAAGGLRLRMFAAVGLACVALFAICDHEGTGVVAMLRAAAFASLVVNAAAFAWFGIALPGTAVHVVPDLRPYRLAFAAALSLCSSAVSLLQLMSALIELARDHPPSRGALSLIYEGGLFASLEVATPFVALISIALVISVISGFARRRGIDALRSAALGQGVGAVTLLLLSVLAQYWSNAHLPSPGVVALAFGLGSAACTFIALRLMVNLCISAAAAIDGTANLPQARLVGPP